MSVVSQLLSRCAKLDSALQRGLDNAFALVFGGTVVPAEIEALLKQEIEDNLVSTEAGVEAPNIFHIGVALKDMAKLQQTHARMPQDFADQMGRYCRNEGWITAGPMVVVVAEESGLRSGQLRVSSYADPQPTEQSRFDSIVSEAKPTVAVPVAAVAAVAAPAPVESMVPAAPINKEDIMDPEDRADISPSQVPATDFFAAQPLSEVAAAPVNSQPSVPQASVTLLLQDGSSRTYHVREGSNIIGRSTEADFRLPDTGVSRQHAEITWDGVDAILVDLKSTNGTAVNDMRIENWLLADGDVIAIGHSHIEVRIVGA
ncbi:DUF3662 and FHA domain-containing protein [Corynebacterium caspium]|uniref:DUF3662 and FHA domain-containing protein n=1 Tax=Corynebacterium caspium TaxID=234828 RepID=UPI00035CD4B6|nr:DUF3662 and FHA domain-containing protein [Corynebacterium caspium]WKD58480.1 FHA domain-containing protein FhaA [Corynebacterium caspium DSM 44850]